MSCWRVVTCGLLLCVLANRLHAAGSGLNVLVVVNQNSSNSVALGNYYAASRQIPPQNFLRINWPGGNVSWSTSDFASVLSNPLQAAVRDRGLSNQITHVVLCMDIPYRVVDSGSPTTAGENSTTAALFYGFKPDLPAVPAYDPSSCNLPFASSNSYAGSEGSFPAVAPTTALTNSFLATMITSSNLAQAKAIVDRGVLSDSSFPQQTVILSKSWDGARNIRYTTFDNTIFDTRLRGNYHVIRDTSAQPLGITNLLGYLTGMYQFSISPNTFVPGAMADSLTSYGGLIYTYNDHTSLLAFMNAGATASYGTIVEPCAYYEKFPSPQAYFYQSRGFNLAECYYQSLTNPYQGLIVGEPLAAPFAAAGQVSWQGLGAGAVLHGTTNLSLLATAFDSAHPLQEMALFVDGVFWQAVTNIEPLAGNSLAVSIRGQQMNYTVPPGATLQSIASDLAQVLNLPANSNATRVLAFAHGDRIELRSTDLTAPGAQVPVSLAASAATAPALTSGLYASGSQFLDTVASAIRHYTIIGVPVVGSYLQLTITKTNGVQGIVRSTNPYGTNTLFQMAQQLIASVNSSPWLTGTDGLSGIDVLDTTYGGPQPQVEFNLVANSPGWAPGQIQVTLGTSISFVFTPNGTTTLDENAADLQPRSHLYVTAGVTNLPLSVALDTSKLSDGWHELTAVAYEGSHVRTQARASRLIRVQNGSLSAALTLVAGGTNFSLASTVQVAVTANPGPVDHIELFTTGGSIGVVSNVTTANFSVSAAFLGPGKHPFYAVVTALTGPQYRTSTQWIQVLETTPAFQVQLTPQPWTVWWPAVVGGLYDVLTSTSPAAPFQIRASVTATNGIASWLDPDPPAQRRFYRVRSAN